MQHMNFYNRLQMNKNSLSVSEQKIANFIITNPKAASNMEGQILVDAVGTSSSTLTRFCKKLGYRNFMEFQTLLSSECNAKRTPSPLLNKIRHYYESVLKVSSELVSEAMLNSLISKIQSSEKILVFGLGSSGLTANEMNTRLIQMGFTSSIITDSFLMRVQSSLFSSRDLVIAISNSGSTQEVLKSCNIAKSVGAQVAAITQNKSSELANISDISLYVSGIDLVGDSLFVNSQLPLIFLVDCITYKLLENKTYFDNRKHALDVLFHRST